jgi:hypothetical protein
MSTCAPDPDDDPILGHRNGDHAQTRRTDCVACLLGYPSPQATPAGPPAASTAGLETPQEV